MPESKERPSISSDSGRDRPTPVPDDGSGTLLPMLIGGLVMIVLGAIVIMNFV